MSGLRHIHQARTGLSDVGPQNPSAGGCGRPPVRTQAGAKLRSTAGFTLAELLISIVFVGLLCIAVSVGLGAALGAYGAITNQANAHQQLARSIQEVNDELAFSISVDTDGRTFESASTRTFITLDNSDEGIVVKGLGIGGAEPDTEGEVLLIPGADGLIPAFAENSSPAYDQEANTWRYAMEIRSKSSDSVVEARSMSVQRIMPAQG